MAKICSEVGMRKSCVRTVPQFFQWKWLIIVYILIAIPNVCLSCQGVNMSVSVYPEGTVYVRYGDPLELFCVAENYASNDIEFQENNKVIPSDIVNSTTRRLYISHPKKQVHTIYCINKLNKNICTTRVLVDSLPGNVTNFSCISNNLEKLNCTWKTENDLSVINYSLKFFIFGNAVEPCKTNNTGNISSCEWSASGKPRYRQMETTYNFHLNSCNHFGCNGQNFTIDHFAIVKPDPVKDLTYRTISTHSVLLRWKIPINIENFLACGVDHRIEYQIAKIDNTSYFRSVDTSSLPPRNNTYTFLLDNLPYAYMQYEVRVYIKSKADVKEEFWSKFQFVLFYTESERPSRPPDTIIGAFNQNLYETKRMIYVYWKQLEEYEEAGTNFTYKVIIYQHNSDYQTVLADKNKSLSYIVLENASLDAINVSVWSMNDNGSSINSTHLYIPPYEDTKPLEVRSFTKLAYENGTYKLSWDGIKNIDSYTLFWCQHNSTKICSGRMNFTMLNPNSTEHVIDLPRANRYQFAISANNGLKTSGMVWAICDISKDAIAMYGYPVQMNHDAPGKTFVKITWKMSCMPQDGIITGFIISYCPVLDTSNKCATNKTVFYITDPKQMEINITNLEPYTTYLFTLALSTKFGEKLIENASTGVTTIEDTPSNPVNIAIKNITYDSLVISWDPPLHKNGVIGKYVINNNGKEIKSVKVPNKDVGRKYEIITGLQPFTNYSWTVQACNTAIGSCSIINQADSIYVRTSIGPPGILKAPAIKNNPDILTWDPPYIPGGTVDYYEIKRITDDNTVLDIMNTTDTKFSIVHCQGGVGGEAYQVRAVNYDDDQNHGAYSDRKEVVLPVKNDKIRLKYLGEWSPASTVSCKTRNELTMTLVLMSVFALIGLMYCLIKCYKKYRKMEDIKPVLPNGLGVPEKDISKYAFGGWNPSTKEEKPSSDEMLLLPNALATVPLSEVKEKENICISSDNTDSTALSANNSQGLIERQISTSDDGSNTSLHLEAETPKVNNENQQEEDSSNSDSEASQESSPYFTNRAFKKNTSSAYVQQPRINQTTGYVPTAQPPHVITPTTPLNPSSSYVMAALSPPIFTTGVTPLSVENHSSPTSGYVRPEDTQPTSTIIFPKLESSPTELFGPESLPTMPTLPMSAKHGVDNNYIQLQSLDSLPSHKQPIRSTVPLKPPTSSGYVSSGDAVINKHLNHMLSGGHMSEESAILDPAMSPDAYCRFSWSTDPANDNLHSLFADSSRLNSSKH